MNVTIPSLDKMSEFSEVILDTLKERARLAGNQKAIVVGLSGDLGSGKTTFSQCLSRQLGVAESVTSPTFVIEKIYKTTDGDFETLVHIDAYRLENPREVDSISFSRLLNSPRTLVLVEWPEKMGDAFPSDAAQLHFAFLDEKTREVSY